MRARALLLAGWVACASAPEEPPPETPYRPDRRDYATFAAAWPDLLEPNYLPFMVHRAPGHPAEGDLLFFCRWDDGAMPIAVYVAAAEIPPDLQDEFDPKEPGAYSEAVRRAFETWERQMEGLVRFRLVDREEQARLTVRLVADRAPAPEPDRQVLGETRLAGACRVGGLDPDAERLDVSFEVNELRLFLADEFGLLPADQVQWIALHEIGHALGMRGHSPIPADLMYEVARDRMIVHEGLSNQDLHSFLSLYQLPNGAIFGRVPTEEVEPAPDAPGLPRLSMAPYVDARHGYEFHPPSGWTRVPTALGVAVANGPTWDYTASFQIVVQRYETIEHYVDRYAAYYLSRGRMSPPADLVVNGRRAVQVEIERVDAPLVEQVTLVEVGDGRVLVITADCLRESIEAYRPIFSATLASLEIRNLPRDAWPPRRR